MSNFQVIPLLHFSYETRSTLSRIKQKKRVIVRVKQNGSNKKNFQWANEVTVYSFIKRPEEDGKNTKMKKNTTQILWSYVVANNTVDVKHDKYERFAAKFDQSISYLFVSMIERVMLSKQRINQICVYSLKRVVLQDFRLGRYSYFMGVSFGREFSLRSMLQPLLIGHRKESGSKKIYIGAPALHEQSLGYLCYWLQPCASDYQEVTVTWPKCKSLMLTSDVGHLPLISNYIGIGHVLVTCRVTLRY